MRRGVLFLLFFIFSASIIKGNSLQCNNLKIYNVKNFGAVGDGKTDDTQPIQKAINEAIESGGTVFIPQGIYLITETIQIPLLSYSTKRTLGIESEWATIKAGKEMDSCINVNIAAFLTIQRLIIDGNNLAKHGFTAFKISGKTALVEQICVHKAKSVSYTHLTLPTICSV